MKNIAALMTGTVLSQIIAILTIPVLSRIYLPEDFGQLAVVMVFSNIAGVILALRYEMALMLPKSDSLAFQIMFKSIIIAIFMTLLEAMILTILFDHFLENYSIFFYVIILCSFFNLFFQLSTLWFNRQRKFKTSAYFAVFKVISIFGMQFLLSEQGNGMIYGYMYGNMIIFFILFFIYLKDVKKIGINTSKLKLFYILKRYKKFPIYSVPASLMNSSANNIQFILIEQLFGSASAGILSMLTRLIYAPAALIGKTVNNVVFQHFTKEISHKKMIFDQMKKITLFISAIGFLVIILILIIYKYNILIIILGENWSEVNNLLIYFIPLIFTSIVSTSISRFAIFEKQEIGMYFQGFMLICVITSVILGEAVTKNFQQTTILYSIILSLVFILQLNISLYLAKNHDNKLKGKKNVK